MTFFNKKEDVLKIELTPHGRKLLSMGKMKPLSWTTMFCMTYQKAEHLRITHKQKQEF
jgi:hypothetical protein